uniref:1-phosphofructokinase n=1 Tax=Eubacterium cellulosolvens TaxID=29322 RepID=UPI0004841A76|nr:1-phosphofructokinase [[Eubacterium] cellulosolvens]
MILTVTANPAIDKRYIVRNLLTGEVNRVQRVEMSAGGKGLNVARTAHIAGEEVLATGFLGGHAGEFVQETIKSEGVKEDFVWCQGETRSCINIWDEERKVQTEVLEPGFSVTSSNEDALIAKFEDRIEKAEVAAISGSLPAGCCPELYRKMLEIGEKAGKKVILDTSGEALREGIHYRPFMIKPNIDEIGQLVGRKLHPENREEIYAAADELHEMGIPVVVISLGASGSLMSCQEGVFRAGVPKIEAVNTVGCGDSMIGGFTVGISRGMSLPECLKFASAVSTAAAMTERTGFFRMEDMEKIAGEIEIDKIR